MKYLKLKPLGLMTILVIAALVISKTYAMTHYPQYMGGSIGDSCIPMGTGIILGHEKTLDLNGSWDVKHAWEAFPPVGSAACISYGTFTVAVLRATSTNIFSITGAFLLNGIVDVYAAGFISGVGHAEYHVKVYLRVWDQNTSTYMTSTGQKWDDGLDNPWPVLYHRSHTFSNEIACDTLIFTPEVGHIYHIEGAFEVTTSGWAGAAGVSGGVAQFYDYTTSSSIRLTSVTITYPYTLTINSSSGGTTYPLPGTYSHDEGTVVSVHAIPNQNYYFDHWLLDGIYNYSNPISVTMTNNHSLFAFFYYNGGGGGCPALFAWNGTNYVDYGVVNIHNPSGEDVVKEVPIEIEDLDSASHKARLRLREGWPGLNFSESEIDQVKLYAISNEGNRVLCPLISASHSRLGSVLLKLLLSDNWKIQSFLLETIDLTFIIPYIDVQGYIFIIEGCNFYKM